jgi:exosome complex component MTR3
MDGANLRHGKVTVDVKLATFATPGARGKATQGDAEREFASLVHRALEGVILTETFPKTAVDVYATVLETGGGELSATIAAASVALADAGVAMRDLVSACAVARVRGGPEEETHETLVLDPSASEEGRASGSVVVACACASGEATQTVATGAWDGDALEAATRLCASGCARVDQRMREVLRAGNAEGGVMAGMGGLPGRGGA